MWSRGVLPNIVSYASLARPYAHQGNWMRIEELAEKMESEGLIMNEYFLYTLLLAYASARPRQGDRAEATFRKASIKGVKINKFVLTAAARAMGRIRCNELVIELGVTC